MKTLLVSLITWLSALSFANAAVDANAFPLVPTNIDGWSFAQIKKNSLEWAFADGADAELDLPGNPPEASLAILIFRRPKPANLELGSSKELG